MGYKYKEIDNRRQEAPFLILEKNIYQNLNVSSIGKITEINNSKYMIQLLPKNINIECNMCLDGLTLSKGDFVLVLFLDNYGIYKLDESTESIMHDYKNSVIIGKINM